MLFLKPETNHIISKRITIYMNQKLKHVLKSTLLGFILYGLAGFLTGFIIETFFGSDHPHSLPGILMMFFPLYMAPVGAVLGLISSLIVEQFSKVVKILLIGLFLCLFGLVFFFFS